MLDLEKIEAHYVGALLVDDQTVRDLYRDVTELVAEVRRLRLDNATARNDGIEAAALWHEAEAAFWENPNGGILPEEAMRAACHRQDAEKLRALKTP